LARSLVLSLPPLPSPPLPPPPLGVCHSKERGAELEAENAKLRKELSITKGQLERWKAAFGEMSAMVSPDAGDAADAPSPAAENAVAPAEPEPEPEPETEVAADAEEAEDEGTILCIGLKKGGQGERFWFRIGDISKNTVLWHNNPSRGRKQTVIDMDLSTIKFAYRTAAASEFDEQRKAALPSTENFEHNPWLRDLFNNVSYCYAAEAIHDYDGDHDQASELNDVKAEMTPQAFIAYFKDMLETAEGEDDEDEDGEAIVVGEEENEDNTPPPNSPPPNKKRQGTAAFSGKGAANKRMRK
jgi:hypothetical protein